MSRITRTLLDTLAPSDKEFFIWDSEVKGFGVRVMPQGAKTFVLKYRIGRATRRYSIGKVGSPYTIDEARKVAAGLLREVREGRDPQEAKAKAREAMTVSQLIDAYLAEGPASKPDKKAISWDCDRTVLNRHVRPLLGKKMAQAITKAHLERLQADVTAGKTAVTEKGKLRGRARVRGGNRVGAVCIVTIGAMYAWGIERGHVTHNPARGVKRNKSEGREVFLSASDIALLTDALTALETERKIGSPLADAIRMLMLTGCRKSEIAKLEWAWVDFDKGYLRLPDSKTGKKDVALAAPALAILARQTRKEGTPFVFPGARGKTHAVGLQKAWAQTRVRATADSAKVAAEAGDPAKAKDLMKVRLHDLRHSFASFAVADGASLFMVGKILGHRQERTTAIYAHLSDDPIRQLTERTAAKIAAAMGEGPAGTGGQVVKLPRTLQRSAL